MTVRRTEKPASSAALPEKPVDPSAKGKRFSPLMEGQPERGDDGYRPIIRAKSGAGSYEDPNDQRKRGKGKSGKPGQ